jgi:hypothetical protein
VEESYIDKIDVLLEIYEGWKNFAFPSPKVEELATRRIAICVKNNCGKFQTNKFCSLCGCYMPAKTRNPKSHCRLKKW